MNLQIDKDKLERDGYLVVDGLLDPQHLTALRQEAVALGAQNPKRWGWNEHSCFRRADFRRLLECAPLVELGRQLIGDDVQLLQFDLLRVHACGGEEYWHRDVERVFDETLCFSCAIYLQDTPRGAGALLIVPGSHRWKASPTVACDGFRERAISVPVGPGAAVIHDSGLWHSASLNAATTDC